MTTFGLIVAIPAVLGYNALTRGNRAIITKLNRLTHDLHTYFVTSTRLRLDASRDDAGVRLATVKQQ